MSAAELATAVAAAERAAPAFLASAQDPSALSDVLLPVLTQPWSARSLELARKAENAPAQNAHAEKLMSGVQLPLMDEMDVIQCDNCKRMLLRESMDKHKVRAAAAGDGRRGLRTPMARSSCAAAASFARHPSRHLTSIQLSTLATRFPALHLHLSCVVSSSLLRPPASRCPSPRCWRRTRPSRCPRASTTTSRPRASSQAEPPPAAAPAAVAAPRGCSALAALRKRWGWAAL